MSGGGLYEVFARKERSEPLSHLGTVRAATDDFARVYARSTYDEENWVEMVIVPRHAIIHVAEIEPLVDVSTKEEVGADEQPDESDA